MNRRCPYCGEDVPSFSLNCPRCYRTIPREEKTEEEEDIRGNYRIKKDRAPSVVAFNHKLILVLALIPSLFGFMGLAQMYEREYRKGTVFLCIGLLLFWSLVGLIRMASSGDAGLSVLGIAGMIAGILLFIGVYIAQAFDALVRSLFPRNMFTR